MVCRDEENLLQALRLTWLLCKDANAIRVPCEYTSKSWKVRRTHNGYASKSAEGKVHGGADEKGFGPRCSFRCLTLLEIDAGSAKPLSSNGYWVASRPHSRQPTTFRIQYVSTSS